MAGDAVPTPAVLHAGPGGPEGPADIAVLDRGPGDGTVLRSSALLDERGPDTWEPTLRSLIAWSRVLLLFEDHLGLTRSPAFLDNVLYRLLEAPRGADRTRSVRARSLRSSRGGGAGGG